MNSIASIVAPFVAFPLSMVAAAVTGFVVGVFAAALFDGNINIIVEILVGTSMFVAMFATWFAVVTGINSA